VRALAPILGLLVALVLVASGARPAAEVARADTGPVHKSIWRLSFSDNFTRGINDSSWGLYSGQPGGDPGGWWDPSHVVARAGIVHLQTYLDPRFDNRWVSGGMSNSHALKQTYGKYLVRFRATPGYGVSNVLLLWPVADHWPPEVDFAEDGGTTGGRPSMSATLHYGVDNNQIQRSVSADFTRWHIMGVEWTPGKLVYTLDGRNWATVVSPFVPDEPMEFAIQAQAGTCGDVYTPCPNATTPPLVDLQVDWVTAYAYVGP
jgi:beta-glucanase (GH16 family)